MTLEKSILGGFGYFVPSGTVVDAITVSKTAYPDVDPVENWPSIGCISEVNFEKEDETDTDYCPSASGGYNKTDTVTVVKDIIKFKTRETSAHFWQLMLGFATTPVDEAAQTPFIAKERNIEGWFKLQGRGLDGNDRVVMNVYGKLELDENPKWSKDPTKPGYMFTVIESDIATAEPDGIE